jgi:hypothetical protein
VVHDPLDAAAGDLGSVVARGGRAGGLVVEADLVELARLMPAARVTSATVIVDTGCFDASSTMAPCSAFVVWTMRASTMATSWMSCGGGGGEPQLC